MGLDPYHAAEAYIRGVFDIEGDVYSALRHYQAQPHSAVAELLARTVANWFHSRAYAAWQRRRWSSGTLRFHYDRSNDFYRQFLDSRMVYSCAYFARPDWSLEEAQEAKLDLICRKLDLQGGDRLLDIGCGWGALLFHAAEKYRARAIGCTLSPKQANLVASEISARGLAGRVAVHERDYQELEPAYDRIASVGMFEHVGPYQLDDYFRTIHRLLAPGGLFLNHGIVRPQTVGDTPETLFIERRVFPDGHLVHLSDVMRSAEQAGFEVLDVENLRPHYALTCRQWVERLQANRAACLRFADEATWRTWVLYLAGSVLAFEEASLDVHQVLLARRNAGPRNHMTREYMYRR